MQNVSLLALPFAQSNKFTDQVTIQQHYLTDLINGLAGKDRTRLRFRGG